MSAYYNENDKFAAAWLRELIKAGLIADGEVDERSIADVQPDDVRGFTQCHFFAGIGGWSYALRLAGWPDKRAVWTGSCPCQPWSDANVWQGGGQGDSDPRHLWPACHPEGLLHYAGARKMPADILPFRGYAGPQTENRYSHWIWRQYASAFWDDVRIDRVVPFTESRDPDDEKHIHPLQLDVIERVVVLRSNPGDVVLTPFMGVGSEVYGAVLNGRRGFGVELKDSYFKQAVKNVRAALDQRDLEQLPLLVTHEQTTA